MTIRPKTVKIIDVARAAGVSRATAASALSGSSRRPGEGPRSLATRQRIIAIGQRMGYERSALGAALSLGRTFTVGLVCQVRGFNGRQVDVELYQKEVSFAVTLACAKVGLRLSTIIVGDEGSVTAADVADGRIDGAILATLTDEYLARAIFDRGFPAVSIGSGYSQRRIMLDNAGGIRSAIDHLMDLGHRNIAYVGSTASTKYTSRCRAESYLSSMSELGLPSTFVDIDDARYFLSKRMSGSPTSFVCFNDEMAAILIRQAGVNGLTVPGDISVIGFDNSSGATYTAPELTTVDNSLIEQADAAVVLLQRLWAGENPSPPAVKTSLVIRDSTAPPKLLTK